LTVLAEAVMAQFERWKSSVEQVETGLDREALTAHARERLSEIGPSR
jgi:hypothetical protein